MNDCCQNCSNENSAKLPSVKQISSDGKIRLLCRDQDVVNIKIEIEKGENNDVLYLIAFQENSTGILPKTYLIVSFDNFSFEESSCSHSKYSLFIVGFTVCWNQKFISE